MKRNGGLQDSNVRHSNNALHGRHTRAIVLTDVARYRPAIDETPPPALTQPATATHRRHVAPAATHGARPPGLEMPIHIPSLNHQRTIAQRTTRARAQRLRVRTPTSAHGHLPVPIGLF